MVKNFILDCLELTFTLRVLFCCMFLMPFFLFYAIIILLALDPVSFSDYEQTVANEQLKIDKALPVRSKRWYVMFKMKKHPYNVFRLKSQQERCAEAIRIRQISFNSLHRLKTATPFLSQRGPHFPPVKHKLSEFYGAGTEYCVTEIPVYYYRNSIYNIPPFLRRTAPENQFGKYLNFSFLLALFTNFLLVYILV